jgi:hypothetical protein
MIINMADKLKDATDLQLESLFSSDPVPDDGFSKRVVSRIRRQIWVQRLALPVAFVVGGSIAAKPMLHFVSLLSQLLGAIPEKLVSDYTLPVPGLSDAPVLLLGVALLGTVLMIGRILED